MARTPGTEDVLSAAEFWKRRSLSDGKSVLADEPLWTQRYLDELQTNFVEHPLPGEGTFVEKFQRQLAPASPIAKRLAAEMLWVMFLFPNNMGADSKMAAVREVWEWSGQPLPENPRLLDSAFTEGIGSAGQSFHNRRWMELRFFIALMQRWFSLLASQRESILNSPWSFAQFVDQTQGADRRQLRHMLLHLLFPEDFERISSTGNRQKIIAAFAAELSRLPVEGDPADSPMLRIDRQLRAIRNHTESLHPGDVIDYYRPPLSQRWRDDPTGLEPPIVEEDQLVTLPGIAREMGNILRLYGDARRDPFGGSHPVVDHFRRLESSLAALPAVQMRPNLQVRFSAGQGNWARVPWVAILDSRETTSTQHGVYVVFLFREDLSGVYLTLNQGVTEPRERLGAVRGRQELRERAQLLRVQSDFLTDHGFILDDQIDLRAARGLGSQYEDSTAAYKFYDAARIPDDASIAQDVNAVLQAYDEYLAAQGEPFTAAPISQAMTPEPPAVDRSSPTPDTVRAAADEFVAAIRAAGLRFDPGFVRAFLASVATKPLVILTGLSGSGKTQLALKFGDWIGRGRCLLVPVRPDWTGPESLLGYEDALLPTSPSGARAWRVPPALEFMLSAARDPSLPYLLVLDEMNLAHVERYFADVLSGMESGEPVLPNLTIENGLWTHNLAGPRYIQLPRNLFVIGTVNVDETTYMFSPKVLDRANTLEFRVTTEALGSGGGRPMPLEKGSPAAVAAIATAARDDSWHVAHRDANAPMYETHVKSLHQLLTLGNLEFGHRVFYEALRFYAFLAAMGQSDWKDALDRQVLQKVLPRLSGSRKRLEPTLLRLLSFCESLSFAESPPMAGSGLPETTAPPILPRSHARVSILLASLRTNQFASFAE